MAHCFLCLCCTALHHPIRVESNLAFAAPVNAANPANSKCPIDDPEEGRVSNLSRASIEAVAQLVAI